MCKCKDCQFRDVLSSLSMWLGSGLGDDKTTADDYERRIRAGIDDHIGVQAQLMRTDRDKAREAELVNLRELLAEVTS